MDPKVVLYYVVAIALLLFLKRKKDGKKSSLKFLGVPLYVRTLATAVNNLSDKRKR